MLARILKAVMAPNTISSIFLAYLSHLDCCLAHERAVGVHLCTESCRESCCGEQFRRRNSGILNLTTVHAEVTLTRPHDKGDPFSCQVRNQV